MASRERCLRETYSFLKHALEHELEVDALRQEIAGQLDLVEAFRVLDEGDKGYLTAADVRSFCVRTNRGMREPPAEALMALLRQYDQDVDGSQLPRASRSPRTARSIPCRTRARFWSHRSPICTP